MSDLDLLAIDLGTLVAMDADGRFAHVNNVEREPGPRALVMGCAEGNLVGVRADVPADQAAAVRSIVVAAPAWNDAEQPPAWRGAIAEALGLPPQGETAVPGPIYDLPHDLAFTTSARIVASDTPAGEALISHIKADGMPPAMVEAGFLDWTHLWPPWCAAIVDGEVGATAFAARHGAGVEVGVYTLEAFRGRALAAAVTAAWTQAPSLRTRTLFYSTSIANRASQAVTAKLGVRRFGVSLAVG